MFQWNMTSSTAGQKNPAGARARNRRRQRRGSDTRRCRGKLVTVSRLTLGVVLAFAPRPGMPMRIPRPWSEASACEKAVDPPWPRVYTKYREQKVFHGVRVRVWVCSSLGNGGINQATN